MKKTLVGLALLASFLLPACQNKTSVAGSASVSASSHPISDSAVTSVPASPSVSVSTSTSVVPEESTKITKEEFVNLLSDGLTNMKVESFYDNYQYAGNSDHYIGAYVGNSYRYYFPDSRDTYAVLDNGILTQASLVIENGKQVYEPVRIDNLKDYGYTCAYDAYRGSLFDFIGVDYDNTLADFRAAASSFYDTLTYNETEKSYQVTLADENLTAVTMTFENQILVAMTLIGNIYGYAYQFFDVGKATLDIPEDCQKVLGYKTVSYYSEDGSTLFDTQYVNTGFGIPDSKTYPKKAGPDKDHFSYFSKWVLLDGSAVPESITSDISVKPVFATHAYTEAFTENATTSTLAVTAMVMGQLANRVWDLYLPESSTETTLDLSRAGFFENATYHLNSSITDIVGLQGRGYRIDLNGNTHFVIKNNLLLSADGTKVYGYTDENATSFTLPEGVTKLVDGAFEGSKATQIALPSTLATIGESAFYGCYYLKNLALPNSVTSIGKDCFDHCGLTSFSWPSAIAVVPEKCFYNCRNLSSLTLPEGVTKLDRESFCMTIALKSLTLPSTLTSIVQGAFEMSGLTSIAIPEKVTALDAGAFYNCQSLASIAFAAKSSLTAIGDSCFMYAGLTSFTLPSTVTNLGNSVFQSCKKLVKADFSANTTLTYIPNGTFRGDFSLTEVKIGASITSLGSYCFADTALTAFTIPGTVTVIGNGAFSGLDDVVITDSSTADYLDGNLLYQDSTKSNLLMALGKVTSYQAPASLKTFSESAFAGHTSLTSLDLSQIPATTASVTIGYNSFYGSGISSLTFPSQTTTQFTLENDAFYGTSFTSLTLPKSVTSIGNVGFAECHSLAHVDLSQSGITSLSASLFAGDNALEDVILPAGLTSIGSYVFSDCSQLQAIYLRETSEPDTSIYTPVTTTGTGWNCISSASYFNTYSVIAPYYLYSETKPTSNVSHYWHYVDSKPVVWQNEE